MSIIGEMYEEDILPPLYEKIKLLEAKILEFSKRLEKASESEDKEGVEAHWWSIQYNKHFSIIKDENHKHSQ